MKNRRGRNDKNNDNNKFFKANKKRKRGKIKIMKFTNKIFNEKNEVISENSWYGLSEKTIEKLKNIGIKETGIPGQYSDKDHNIYVYDNKHEIPTIILNVRLTNAKDLNQFDKYKKLAEEIFEIIKEEY